LANFIAHVTRSLDCDRSLKLVPFYVLSSPGLLALLNEEGKKVFAARKPFLRRAHSRIETISQWLYMVFIASVSQEKAYKLFSLYFTPHSACLRDENLWECVCLCVCMEAVKESFVAQEQSMA
jgi:hypothetical protein